MNPVLVTLPFRCADMYLFSSKCVSDGVRIYSGVDYEGRSEADFFKTCIAALNILKNRDVRHYQRFKLYVKRIIGWGGPTGYWSIPRSVELNYDLVFQNDISEIACVLVGIAAIGRLWKLRSIRRQEPQRFYDACFRIEMRFREKLFRQQFSDSDRLVLRKNTPWLPTNRTALLLQELKNLRKR